MTRINQTHNLEAYIDGDGWMCKDDSPESLELFGTDTLPLPFLRDTPASLVLSTLKELNPNANVAIRA